MPGPQTQPSFQSRIQVIPSPARPPEAEQAPPLAVPPAPEVTVRPLPNTVETFGGIFPGETPPVAAPEVPKAPETAFAAPRIEPTLPPAAVRPAERDEIRAALLVPLSGPHAAWGQALSNAAQLALFDVADARLNLIPLDTRGTADGAAAAVRQAITQGADIVLGPLFSPEVKAAAPLAREQGVPMLAFTTDRSAAGQGVYALGFLPDTQVARVVAQARAEGREHFAMLTPSTEYGRAMADIFRTAVTAQGGKVVKIDYYDPQASDHSAVVKRFTEVEARTRGRTKENAATTPVPPPPFDAVMIPDEGVRLRSLTSLITYFEVDPGQVRFLGTMMWDDPRLAAEPSLQGGWYPAAAIAAHQDFESRYTKAFGALPARVGSIASISYDATALAAALGKINQGDYAAAALTSPSGFAGVDGVFRLKPDGTSERGLAVKELRKDGVREVAPPPVEFGR